MANNVMSALDMARPGMSRLRSTAGGMGYQAANIQAEQPKSSLLESLGRFAKAGTDVYQAREEHRKGQADAQSNEIIRKMTPEQIREASNNGTLLYQDNPYAMASLRQKVGRNAAYEVDNDAMTQVKAGKFKTRQELDEYRHQKLQEKIAESAELYGFNPEDEDFKSGYDADITQRNVAIYGAHDQYVNVETQKGAMVNTTKEMSTFTQDPAFLASPQGADQFTSYVNTAQSKGDFPNDDMMVQSIGSQLQNIAAQSGGAIMLRNLADKEITVHGKKTTYRQLYGEEVWKGLEQKADRAQYDNDAKATQALDAGIFEADQMEEPEAALERIHQLQAENNKLQPGEEMTPQRQKLIAAEERQKARIRERNDKQAAEFDALKRKDNTKRAIKEQWRLRLHNDNVSTDPKDLVLNEDMAKPDHEMEMEAVQEMVTGIDNSKTLTDAQKDASKLDLLAKDRENGPFRTLMASTISDANKEYQGAILNGVFPKETPALDKFERMYNANPQLIAGLYPEQAGLIIKLQAVRRQGLDPQVLIEAERHRKSMSQEERQADDKAWQVTLNEDIYDGVGSLPTDVEESTRSVYDAVKNVGGDDQAAREAAVKYAKENTVSIKSEEGSDHQVGVISKRTLQVTSDPASWQTGLQLLNARRGKYLKDHPWLKASDVMVRERNGEIYLFSLNGAPVHITREQMAQDYKEAMEHNNNDREAALAELGAPAPKAKPTVMSAPYNNWMDHKNSPVPKGLLGQGYNK